MLLDQGESMSAIASLILLPSDGIKRVSCSRVTREPTGGLRSQGIGVPIPCDLISWNSTQIGGRPRSLTLEAHEMRMPLPVMV